MPTNDAASDPVAQVAAKQNWPFSSSGRGVAAELDVVVLSGCGGVLMAARGEGALVGVGLGLLGLVVLDHIETQRRTRALERARERQRTRGILMSFVSRAREYDDRMMTTLATPAIYDPALGEAARRDPWSFLNAMVRWVYREVRWTRDEVTFGVSEYWQSPEETLASRRGDCEDMALLALRFFQSAGVQAFRIVVGVWNGGGHAWLETADGLFADPVRGIVVRGRPHDYEPALMLGGPDPLMWPVAA